MKEYKNKDELIDAIYLSFKKYIAEFVDIPENLKNKIVVGVDRSPSQNLSYQIGWLNLLLAWEAKEKAGQVVYTPAEGFRWNNLGGLYQSFYEKYSDESLSGQIETLSVLVDEVCHWLAELTEQELFEPEQRQWAITDARWPLWKWIHINTVAPFTNFRTKIRKWKKFML